MFSDLDFMGGERRGCCVKDHQQQRVRACAVVRGLTPCDASAHAGEFYKNIVRMQRHININQANKTFGFDLTSNIGMENAATGAFSVLLRADEAGCNAASAPRLTPVFSPASSSISAPGQVAFPAVQASPSFPTSFPGILDPEATCLIPCAIDQVRKASGAMADSLLPFSFLFFPLFSVDTSATHPLHQRTTTGPLLSPDARRGAQAAVQEAVADPLQVLSRYEHGWALGAAQQWPALPCPAASPSRPPPSA